MDVSKQKSGLNPLSVATSIASPHRKIILSRRITVGKSPTGQTADRE
jgi:hypothetical protein